MAKLEYEYPIKSVRGKLKDSFGANKRKLANAKGKQEPFSIIFGERDLTNHPVTEAETAHRDKFKAIQALVAARQKNASQKVTDAVAFKAQTAAPTMKKYLWNVCTAQYLATLDPGD